MNDLFYQSMTDNQLQATFNEIKKNLVFDATPGMTIEMELIKNIARERGIELGDAFDAVKGFLEFTIQDLET